MKDLAENRRARFDYDIKETFEAGIELRGHEVKSVRNGQFQIAGAQVLIRPMLKTGSPEAWLVNSHIPAYQPKNVPAEYTEDRERKLLLTKKEIRNITAMLHDKSERLIPLRAYLKNGFVKLSIGIGRMRRKSDQREVLKKRAQMREMRDV
jgi:SsrA-binding protein